MFYWLHPESSSVGKCETESELVELLDSDPCVQEITASQYEEINASHNLIHPESDKCADNYL